MQFHETLLQEGFEGGAEAAYQLHNEIQTHMQSYEHAKDWKTIVRIYVDLDTLFKTLNDTGLKINRSTLHQFSRGFTQYYSLFDLVDVSSRGRAHVEQKMKGTLLIEATLRAFLC